MADNKRIHADITADNKDFNRKTDQAAKKGNWLGGQFKKIGGVIAGAMAGAFAFNTIIKGLKAVITNSVAFEKALANLSAITGATGGDLKFYGQAARDLARETTMSAVDIVEAFKLMGSARPELLKNKDALAAVTKEAIILAEASGMDATTATLSLAKAMNQFNIPAREAGRAINVLAAGSKFGSEEIPGVADAIKNMGTAANGANISLENSVALIEALAEKGISGAESGTMLRNIIIKLQNGADKFNPKIVGMSKALSNLSDENMTSAEMTKLFGLENINAATILIDSVARIDELTEAVTGTNTAYEQHAIIQDTVSAKYKIFKDTLADMTIKGEGFTDSLKTSLTAMTDNLQALQTLSSSDNIKWWEKAAIYVNGFTGSMRLSKEEMEALDEARDKSLKSLSDFIDLEEELVSITGEEIKPREEAIKVFNEQTATIGEFSKEIKKLSDAKEELGAGDKEELSRLNQLIDKYTLAQEALSSYGSAASAVAQPSAEFAEIIGQTDEQLANFMDTLTITAEEPFVLIGERIKEVSEMMLLAQGAAQEFGAAMMASAANSEDTLKTYGKTVANTIRSVIKAYIAEGVAAAASRALAGLPFPANIIAGPIAAGAATALFNSVIPAFAQGGAVSGPTLALVGEGPGVSRSNPEYIGTAKQMGQMNQGGGGGGTARFLRISRGDLVFAVNESSSYSKRTH